MLWHETNVLFNSFIKLCDRNVETAAVKVSVIMGSVSLLLFLEGQSAEFSLYFVWGNNFFNIFWGYYFGNAIQNSKLAKVAQYCISYKERGQRIDYNFNVAI
jgi:hypothetical protein